MKGHKMAFRMPNQIFRPVQKPLSATQTRWQKVKPRLSQPATRKEKESVATR
jgi:hypothetical protein